MGITHKSKDFDVIKKYYKAYNSKNYKKLDKIIADNIIVIEMNYTVLNSKTDFINLVKWGEVFDSKNKKSEIREENGVYITEEIQDSERIQFLYGHALKSKTTFTIKNGKISKIEVDLLDFNLEKMNKKRNEFMSWVKINHPHKLSTINQLNKVGGETFKEAMVLYNKK